MSKQLRLLCLLFIVMNVTYAQDERKQKRGKTETKVEKDGLIVLKAYQNVTVEGNKEEEKEEQAPTSDKVKFGVRLPKEVKTERTDNDTVFFKLQELRRRNLRDYYNRTNPKYDFKNKIKNGIQIIEKSKGEDKQTFQLEIPPLRANKIYRIKATEVESLENIYNMYLTLHKEGIDDWFNVEKDWMKLLKKLNDKTKSFPIIYYPTEQELMNYKAIVENIDLKALTNSEKKDLLDKTIEVFSILNFKTADPPTVDKMTAFITWIQSDGFDKTDDEKFSDSSTFTSYYDYINVYNFYIKYLKKEFKKNNYSFEDIEDVKVLVDKSVAEEKSKYRADQLLPNYLKASDKIIASSDVILNTFSDSFGQAFKRSLVPDFGLVAYRLGASGNVKGTPFVGVNISLAPVNKDVSLSQSRLSFWQRTSIHTGVTLNSLAEDNKREDFFKNLSLMLGGGYKIGTQATRLNVGGILYNKIDAITGDKSFAVVPYVGLSIDIEIRKWLQEIIPSYSNNFKKSE